MNNSFKVIIAGSRNFDNYHYLKAVCDYFLDGIREEGDIEIVSGMARGADAQGEMYALSSGFKLTRFPAHWNKYGRSAGYKRNTQMAEYADYLISFQLNNSRGTAHMIKEAKRLRLRYGNGESKQFCRAGVRLLNDVFHDYQELHDNGHQICTYCGDERIRRSHAQVVNA